MLVQSVDKIITDIKNKEVVCIPTDTVYGLSALVNQECAQKIISLKNRDSSKGFIIISSNPSHLLKYIDASALGQEHIIKINTHRDNPTTWVAPAKKSIKWLTGGKDTVAVRLVDTKTISKICSEINDAILSTSANISGEEFINEANEISKKFADINILESESNKAKPSMIIDLISGIRIR